MDISRKRKRFLHADSNMPIPERTKRRMMKFSVKPLKEQQLVSYNSSAAASFSEDNGDDNGGAESLAEESDEGESPPSSPSPPDTETQCATPSVLQGNRCGGGNELSISICQGAVSREISHQETTRQGEEVTQELVDSQHDNYNEEYSSSEEHSSSDSENVSEQSDSDTFYDSSNDESNNDSEEESVDTNESDNNSDDSAEDSSEDPDDPDDPPDPQEDPDGEFDEEPRQPYSPPSTHPSLTEILGNGGYSEVIHLPPQVCKGEALLMALSIAYENNLSHSAFQNVVGFFNTVFNNPVLPNSGYLLDKLLNSDIGIDRHFYCTSCYYYLGKLDYKNLVQVPCPNVHCNFVNVIKNLCRASYFLTFDVALHVKHLLEDENIYSHLINPWDMIHENNNEQLLKDVYDGSMYQEFARFSNRFSHNERVISFQFFTDGSPCFKSSSCSIWPLLLIINELPPIMRMSNMILGALWFGNKKPPMDLFLDPFVVEMNSLGANGFVINVNDDPIIVRPFVIACCVDSGARGSVQGLKSHNGYFSCNWCKHPGLKVNRRVKFPCPEVRPHERTHQNFIEQFQVIGDDGEGAEGVTSVSPLMNLFSPPFDLVRSMIVEPLHASHLGVARQMLKLWLCAAGEPYYIGSPENLEKIDNRIKLLTPPRDIRRPPRSVKLRKVWKGREWENWILYFSLSVLIGILPDMYLRHWSLYVQGMHLLSRDSVSQSQTERAHKLINTFVVRFEILYGESAMTFNVHINSHLAENVARWGPLWAVSANAFESGNGDLKKIIKVHHGIPHQICRVMSSKNAINILKKMVPVSPETKTYLKSLKHQEVQKGRSFGNTHFLGTISAFLPNEEELWLCENFEHNPDHCVCYNKVVIDKCLYRPEKDGLKLNNSVALMKNSHLILIKKIIFDQDLQSGFILGHQIHASPVLNFQTCCAISSSESCLRKIDVIEADMSLFKLEDLHIVCVRNRCDARRNEDYVVPLTNIFNVM